MTKMISNPEPNETKAACRPLSRRCESSPFARACNAIIAPERAANKSKRITYECRGTRACLRSNPSMQREHQREQM